MLFMKVIFNSLRLIRYAIFIIALCMNSIALAFGLVTEKDIFCSKQICASIAEQDGECARKLEKLRKKTPYYYVPFSTNVDADTTTKLLNYIYSIFYDSLEQEQAFYSKQINALISVKDRESADKAAKEIAELRKKYPYDPMSPEIGYDIDIITYALVELNFYGSEELARVLLGEDYLIGILPEAELTPEIEKALSEQAMKNAEGILTGGPGFDTTTAWGAPVNPEMKWDNNLSLKIVWPSSVNILHFGWVEDVEYTVYPVYVVYKDKKYQIFQNFIEPPDELRLEQKYRVPDEPDAENK